MKLDPEADPTARRIYKRGSGQKAAFLSTTKMPGMIQGNSQLEATLAWAADIDSRVVRGRPQPMTFDLMSGRSFATKDELWDACRGLYKPLEYTPDFELSLRSGERVLIETKLRTDIEKNQGILELPAILYGFGHRLIIVTDDLLRGVLQYNARLLASAGGLPPAGQLCEVIRAVAHTGTAISEIMSRAEVGEEMIFSLIRSGAIGADLTGDRLGKCTRVWSAHNSQHLEVLPL